MVCPFDRFRRSPAWWEYGSRFKCAAVGLGHAGSGVLGGFCGAVGLGGTLSEALPYRGPGEAVFDRGAVLSRMALVAAGGGGACSAIEALHAEPEVFGGVPSTSTVHRVFTGMDEERVEAAASAVAGVRQRVWPMIGDHPRHRRGAGFGSGCVNPVSRFELLSAPGGGLVFCGSRAFSPKPQRSELGFCQRHTAENGSAMRTTPTTRFSRQTVWG